MGSYPNAMQDCNCRSAQCKCEETVAHSFLIAIHGIVAHVELQQVEACQQEEHDHPDLRAYDTYDRKPAKSVAGTVNIPNAITAPPRRQVSKPFCTPSRGSPSECMSSDILYATR